MIELLLQAEGALSVGLLDRAETLYRQVATADPRNAIAIVGLSRVALERGNQEESLELARRGLAIDPENVAAQRMVQRLEEVLTFRGIQLPSPPAVDTATAATAAPDQAPAARDTVAADEAAPRSLVDRLFRRR